MIPSFQFLFAILAALGLSRIVYVLYRAAVDPLRSVPGPFLARFTRLWWFGALAREDFEKTNISLHKKHGMVDLVATYLCYVVVSNPNM